MGDIGTAQAYQALRKRKGLPAVKTDTKTAIAMTAAATGVGAAGYAVANSGLGEESNPYDTGK